MLAVQRMGILGGTHLTDTVSIDSDGDPWTLGRRDAESGSRPQRDNFAYMNGYTSPRKWTETWEAYCDRRKPYIQT